MPFNNKAFEALFQRIVSRMPAITFAGIMITYLVTAILNVYFLPLPLWLSIPAAVCIQFTRFAVVFMDFLNPTGKRSRWPEIIAAGATVAAVAELAFSAADKGYTGAAFWSLFLFGAMLISAGYLLEINFVLRGLEAYQAKDEAAIQADMCAGCGASYQKKTTFQKYCSDRCRKRNFITSKPTL
jgi:hypothetical protein